MSLPEPWINRIFERLAALYGSRLADLWSGSDRAAVVGVWAASLGGYVDRPQVIAGALRDCESLDQPPTLPAFKRLCAQRAGQQRYAALPAPSIDPDVARARLVTLREQAGFAVDPLFWAKRPLTAKAVDLLVSGARSHPGLRQILADHLASGGEMCRSPEATARIRALA